MKSIKPNIHQDEVEKILQCMVIDHNLIKRVGKANNLKDDDLVITSKGDQCLRDEQIARHGDYSYYKYFDRTLFGPNGVAKYAPIPTDRFQNKKNQIDTNGLIYPN